MEGEGPSSTDRLGPQPRLVLTLPKFLSNVQKTPALTLNARHSPTEVVPVLISLF